jgi:hypothetical protein
MATFRPGQRIKKVRGLIAIGITGTFVEYLPLSHHSLADMSFRLDQDAYSIIGALCKAGEVVYGTSDNFEPIVDDGLQMSSWDEIPFWNPSHLVPENA